MNIIGFESKHSHDFKHELSISLSFSILDFEKNNMSNAL